MHPARFTLPGHTIQGGQLLCLFLESMLAPWCQHEEGLGGTQQSLLRRRLPPCGLRAAGLELARVWQSGQGQVLSKHRAHSAASPSPLAPVESSPGRMRAVLGKQVQAQEGGPFLGQGLGVGEGS